MKSTNLTDLIEFAEGTPLRRTVFESERLWSEIVCLDAAQEVGPIGDPCADGLFVVFAGAVMVFLGPRRKRLNQWDTVVAPAGTDVILRNASAEPAVVLVVTAPPPGSPETQPEETPASESESESESPPAP